MQGGVRCLRPPPAPVPRVRAPVCPGPCSPVPGLPGWMGPRPRRLRLRRRGAARTPACETAATALAGRKAPQLAHVTWQGSTARRCAGRDRAEGCRPACCHWLFHNLPLYPTRMFRLPPPPPPGRASELPGRFTPLLLPLAYSRACHVCRSHGPPPRCPRSRSGLTTAQSELPGQVYPSPASPAAPSYSQPSMQPLHFPSHCCHAHLQARTLHRPGRFGRHQILPTQQRDFPRGAAHPQSTIQCCPSTAAPAR